MVMMTRIQLENYRCIRNADVRLSPLTVLVGANSSGKSSLLASLRPDARGRLRAEDFWQRDHTLPWRVIQEFDSGATATSSIEPEISTPVHFAYQLVHLDLAALRSENLAQRTTRIEANGHNLTNLFASLARPAHQQIAQELSALVPSIRDIAHEPTERLGHQNLKFQDRWNPKVWYPPSEVSDGTMLVVAYLLLQHQDPPLDLIAIEEPERGLHPYLLGELVSMWRRMTTGEIGPRPVQIVLATHSAELLDHVQPSEVRFLSRDVKTGSVRIEEAPGDDEEWRDAYRTYQDSLGSMWLSGGLGGVPGS